MNVKKIGVFGSAFNPPTQGHADVIEQIAPNFDEILLVPSAAHAFNKGMLPFNNRVTLLEKFVQQFKQLVHKLTICTIETEMQQQQPDKAVFTFDLLNSLEQSYLDRDQPVQISFILGPDNIATETWQKFYRADDIRQRWALYPVKEQKAIRSTDVRNLIAAGADRTAFTGLLSDEVADYIFETGLYQTDR